MMKLSLDENEEIPYNAAKKVKVNYPLFVKKARNNTFKRAVRDDFKRKNPKPFDQAFEDKTKEKLSNDAS
jgi:hypothetical protein